MNLNRISAVRLAHSLGCTVRPPTRDGDLVFSHPAIPWRCRMNCRRKDSSRRLMHFLNQLQRVIGEGG